MTMGARAATQQAETQVAATHWYDFVEDPERPGDGMQQNPIMEDITSVLRLRYADYPEDVLISGPTFILYDIDNPNARIAPDCYVVFGADPEIATTHNSYRIWQWGKPPDFVVEVASPSTASADLHRKRDIYERIGALEYWRIDPTGGDWYGQPLAAERLVNGVYVPYPLHENEDGDVWARSEVLGIDFYWRNDRRIWMRDSSSGEWLYFLSAEHAARLAAEAEAALARAAEGLVRERAEAAETRAESAEARAEAAEERAESAEARAEALRSKLERERAESAEARSREYEARAEAAEAEAAELRRQLERERRERGE